MKLKELVGQDLKAGKTNEDRSLEGASGVEKRIDLGSLSFALISFAGRESKDPAKT